MNINDKHIKNQEAYFKIVLRNMNLKDVTK